MINGTWYYFDGSGWMVTGWKQVNGSWYYMDASGAMVKNAWVGDYYLGADGAMATNTWIGQYYVCLLYTSTCTQPVAIAPLPVR